MDVIGSTFVVFGFLLCLVLIFWRAMKRKSYHAEKPFKIPERY